MRRQSVSKFGFAVLACVLVWAALEECPRTSVTMSSAAPPQRGGPGAHPVPPQPKEEICCLKAYDAGCKIARLLHGAVYIHFNGVVRYTGILHDPGELSGISYEVYVCPDGTIHRTDGRPCGSYRTKDAIVSAYDAKGSLAYKYPDGTIVVRKHSVGGIFSEGIIITMADGRSIETHYNGNGSLVRFVASNRTAPPAGSIEYRY